MEYAHYKNFELAFGEYSLKGDILGERLSSQVLMLHGAGQSHRGKMAPLRQELLDAGIGSCAFDFIGHGETGGKLTSTSLAHRTKQASAIIDFTKLNTEPLSIVAASMSAHTAVQLTRLYKVEHLVLIVPAMYATAAYKVSFGPDFTRIISSKKSWRNSDGWDLLENFRGDLLVISAEKDKIIPNGVVRSYFDSAKRARSCRIYTVPNAGHMVFTELRQQNPAEMSKVRKMIIDTIL